MASLPHSESEPRLNPIRDRAAAHGALAMTTPGDISMARAAEIEALMQGKGARVIR